MCPSQTLFINQHSSLLSFHLYPTNSELQAAIFNGLEMAQELKPICCPWCQWRKITFILVNNIQLKEKRDGGQWQVAKRNPITVDGVYWEARWYITRIPWGNMASGMIHWQHRHHMLFILCPQECGAVHPGSVLSAKWYNKYGFPSGKKCPNRRQLLANYLVK